MQGGLISLLGFYKLINMKHEAVVNAITYILLSFNLRNFRVKTCDGAGNSMRKMSGVTTRLLVESRKVLQLSY